MSIDFENAPDYEALFNALIAKTEQGKLDWQETANANAFLAAVKGERTFVIECIKGDPRLTTVTLSVQDGKGNTLFDTPPLSGGRAGELFRMAKRVATRVDERIDATMVLLENL